MSQLTEAQLKDELEGFLKGHVGRDGRQKYREQAAQIGSTQKRSIIVDLDDLLEYNHELARHLIRAPERVLSPLKGAVYDLVKTENPRAAEELSPDVLSIRVRGLPPEGRAALRALASVHLERLVAVAGMVVRTSEIKPMIIKAIYVCPRGHENEVPQPGPLLIPPRKCSECGETRDFSLDKSKSIFIDYQVIRLQELPGELPPGQLPQSVDVSLTGDIVGTARPGDRVVVTGVTKADAEFTQAGRLRTFKSRIEGLYVEVLGKEVERLEITPEDEEQIRKIASLPDAYQRLIESIAPSIHLYHDQKEAILLMLAGAPQRILPDGTAVRGDINTLLIGDPGCLVADERVILGNGAIVKIRDLGAYHLQKIRVPLLIGRGARRAVATRFHVYQSQPIIEIVTESGKSIKGTPNHPLLVVKKEAGRLVRRWKRLYELRVKDRVAVVTGFPCTITGHIKTGFKPLLHERGPRFRGSLPKKVTPELASLLGYMLGDGWVGRYRVGFLVAEPEKDLLPRLLRVCRQLFALEPSVRRRKLPHRRVPLYEVMIHSKDIACNLEFLGVKRVPDLMLRSGNKVAASFLKWLFEADGTVYDRGRGRRAICLKSRELELLRDVQILLLRFGIHSRIIENALFVRRGEDILRFAKSVGFASRKKRSRLSRLVSAARTFGRVHRQHSERITRILSHQPADVYDIEVPRVRRFVANGIISHNTAKSELLKFAARLAVRGLYTTGRGSTAAGLTAAVVREKGGMMELEAGAVVLADQGSACIDEFDKMRNEDRQVLHEAMEQQTVSVAKGGIVATLNARTSILAAANPVLGKYDPLRNLYENITLPLQLLTRFDLIFVLRDVPERERDEGVAKHVLEIHKRAAFPSPPPLEFELLKKYMAYSKTVEPVLTPDAEQRILDYYLKLRSMGSDVLITITPRQLEALIRIATARARLLLKDKVTEEDALRAINLFERMLVVSAIDVRTGRTDMGVLYGKPVSVRQRMQAALDVLNRLGASEGKEVAENEFIAELSKTPGITTEEAQQLLRALTKDGQLYEVRTGFYKKVTF